ncbi:hypothetical protein BEWA_054300 [Theileria equi strain WA]|uniref:Uncharacterized protein n=1 Tax=Theileria equi strain WA TaxID=1537102 RepID=L1LDM3_THEEQ|nr:hypothetical protein BEWA_054300 [Theileria equi strain WA]EKX73374.1 hypothetical protein BEWA_054300 [Theileria equi strain WA]|eukprot:XP_004832826.1 hypothetical protein BEWA_054300 [Theileria equi strain WA]
MDSSSFPFTSVSINESYNDNFVLFLFKLCGCGDNGTVIDIANVDSEITHEQTYDQDGAQRSFIPKESFFSEVLDGPFSIWKSDGNTRCSKVFLRLGNNVRRLTLNVSVAGSGSSIKYFEEKKDEEWKSVPCFVAGDLPPVNAKPVDIQKLEASSSCIRVD